jgi:hypothetical protein
VIEHAVGMKDDEANAVVAKVIVRVENLCCPNGSSAGDGRRSTGRNAVARLFRAEYRGRR